MWPIHKIECKWVFGKLRPYFARLPGAVVSHLRLVTNPALASIAANFPLMTFDLDALPPEAVQFLNDRHLATLTTLRVDGSPHVTPVGVTYESSTNLARIITRQSAVKVTNVQQKPDQSVAICQHDGGRWLTLYGQATVSSEPDRVAVAVERYATRYRQPTPRPDRVVMEVKVRDLKGHL